MCGKYTTHANASNTLTVTREQLTGLSPALLSRTVTVDAHNVTATVTTAMDPETHVVTETSWSDTGTPATRRTLYGQLTEAAGLDGGTFLEYDGFARNVSQTVTNVTGTLSITAVTYDTLGNAVTNQTTYGDLTAVTSTGYDSQGRTMFSTDALGNAVTNAYDSLGLTLSLSGATYPVQYAYDTAGHMTALSTTRDGAAWDATGWLYDGTTGLLTNKVYADGSRVFYTFTPDGKPLRTAWARGAWKENAYDALGQLTGTAYSYDTPAVTLARNAFGTVTNASDATGLACVYAVNDRQSVTNETVMSGASTNTLTRVLDGFNRPAGLRLDSGYSLFYGRDSESRISVISNAEFTAQYAYDNGYAAGYTITLSNGNTLAHAVTRDPHRPWLVTSATNLFNGEVVSSWAYAYDINGRIIQRNADSFGYNARSELTSALLYTNAYGYVVDCIGNRLVSTGDDGETTYTANSLNQYTEVNAVARACDADGNLLAFGAWGYGWDAENRLTSVTSNGVPVLSNSYDYRHRRVRKATPAAVRDMVYDGWNLIQESVVFTNGTASISHNYWGLDLSGSLQGAGGVGGLLAVKVDGQLYFPFYDNNGNISEYVDTLGNIRAHYEYSPFGETVAQTGDLADTFPHRFSTKYYDAETSSYYYGYRHYAPTLGCWLSRDPIGEKGGVNLYLFVLNDPVDGFDYFGLKSSVTIIENPVIYTDYPLPNFSGDTFDSGRVTYHPQPPTHQVICRCNKDTGKHELDLTISITLTTKIPGPNAKHPKTGKKRTSEGIKNSESHEELHRKTLIDLFRSVEASYTPLLARTWSKWFDCNKAVYPIKNQNDSRIILVLRMEENHAGQHWTDWFKEHGKESKW